jgi:hypothetical protein
MQPVDRDFDDELSDPLDRLLISLRAYFRRAPRKPKKGEKGGKAKANRRDPRDYYPHTAEPLGFGIRLRNPHRARPTSAVRRVSTALQGPNL